ncbi:hypothetical protein FQN51_004029 [Onygenales sp. PD_10]|nr:hypothetical protein FQN51_004029 [Onygenales sp. PD_10]
MTRKARVDIPLSAAICICICCAPIILPALLHEKCILPGVEKTKMGAKSQRYKHAAPSQMPKMRKRELSFDVPPSGSEGPRSFLPPMLRKREPRRVYTQDQSGFFRLPGEVRQMVYEYVFGTADVHVEAMHGRLGSFHCQCQGQQGRDLAGDSDVDDDALPDDTGAGLESEGWPCEPCFDREVIKRTPADSCCRIPKVQTYADTGIGVLGFLCACRRIYTETINALYSNRTFIFRRPDALLYFLSTIPRHRLDLITSIYIDGSAPDPHDEYMYSLIDMPRFYQQQYNQQVTPEWSALLHPWSNGRARVWDAACLALGQLQGLKSLRVFLTAACSPYNPTLLLSPLRGVSVVPGGWFEVTVNWEGETDTSWVVEDFPFTLARELGRRGARMHAPRASRPRGRLQIDP